VVTQQAGAASPLYRWLIEARRQNAAPATGSYEPLDGAWRILGKQHVLEVGCRSCIAHQFHFLGRPQDERTRKGIAMELIQMGRE
jgi:hypothetical protein